MKRLKDGTIRALRLRKRLLAWSLLTLQATGVLSMLSAEPLPRIITEEGRHQLQVDGEPYLILGAQTNNSSNYPSALSDVWPVVREMGANTVAIPVAWEQIEPKEGHFDFSYLDVLLAEARREEVRLILLWFATWKNNAPHYAPSWVKLDNERFPRVEKRDGELLNSLSPLGGETLEADRRAFVELMTYLKNNDRKHTVIMVQVENEVGTYGAKRDYSALAEAAFSKPVPEALVEGLGREPGDWASVFGADADEFFHAWHIARFCNAVAEAGQAVKDLPMNVNVALRHPETPGDGYSMGGPTDNVLDLWKIAAPAVDLITPDIYFREHRVVSKVLDYYARPDNPLFVSEIGNDQPYARYFFLTLGRQGIGFSPFGMDDTDYVNFPLGAKTMSPETVAPFAELYEWMRPMAADWARISFAQPVWGFAEPDHPELSQEDGDESLSPEERGEHFTQNADLGRWEVEVSYGRHMFWIDPPVGNETASGGVLIARLAPDTFLVSGFRARVTFSPSAEVEESYSMIETVEEGHFEKGEWVMDRIWNGDQTDWGLNFTSRPHLLKVKMAGYSR